jgi:hypothetical protein
MSIRVKGSGAERRFAIYRNNNFVSLAAVSDRFDLGSPCKSERAADHRRFDRKMHLIAGPYRDVELRLLSLGEGHSYQASAPEQRSGMPPRRLTQATRASISWRTSQPFFVAQVFTALSSMECERIID